MPRVTSNYLKELDRNKTIYRYMSFAQFVNLLQNESLHFHQASDFSDRFEGSVPKEIQQARKQEYEKEGLRPDLHEIHSAINKKLRDFTYLNCWHMKDDESVAMWEKYGGSNQAIAIRSTVGDMTVSLGGDVDNHNIYMVKVRYTLYLDDEKKGIPSQDKFFITRGAYSLVPFFYKHKGFEYEQEVRAIIQKPPTSKDISETKVVVDNKVKGVDFEIKTEEGDRYIDGRRSPSRRGYDVKVILDQLVNSIHFAPDASGWFKDTVRREIRKFDLLDEDVLQESAMGHDPFF